MRRYLYSSWIRCWSRGFLHSCSWEDGGLIGGDYSVVFNIGDRSYINNNFRSSHWGGGI